jgi:hypothetical protein
VRVFGGLTLFDSVWTSIFSGAMGVIGGAVAALLLERYKAAHTWNTKLAEWRIDLARRVIAALLDLEIAHAELRAASADLSSQDYKEKFKARRTAFYALQHAGSEALALYPKEVSDKVDDVLNTIGSFTGNQQKFQNSIDWSVAQKEMETLVPAIKEALTAIESYLSGSVSARRR